MMREEENELPDAELIFLRKIR